MSPNQVSPIEVKYRQLGRETGYLGRAITKEIQVSATTAYCYYANGAIYWHSKYGAQLLFGAIREKWNWLAFRDTGEAHVHLKANNGRFVVTKKANGLLFADGEQEDISGGIDLQIAPGQG